MRKKLASKAEGIVLETNVGANVVLTLFRSKLQYIWRFNVGSQDYSVEFFTSRLTAKKTILLNGGVKFVG